MWFKYRLVNSDKHWEFGPGREGPRQIQSVQKWEFDGFQGNLYINVKTAIKYVNEMRDKSSDPVVRQNADKTVGSLRKLDKSAANSILK
jgi:hypothetical protein